MQKTPLKIAATYALVGALWILLSGWLLQFLVADPALITRLTMYKGWAFIAVTAVVLYKLIARDHAKTLHASATSREQERIYRDLFENNPQPMWVYAVETMEFLAVNDAAVDHYGYSRQEFLGMTLRDIRPLDDVPALTASVEKVRDNLVKVGHWQHRKKDSTLIDVEITSHELLFNGRAARLVLINDITERRRVERENVVYQDRLRFLGAEMSLIEERERRQLATVLHDQVGQVLALAKIKLGTLKEAASVAEYRQLSDELRKLLDQAISSSRTLTFELSPPILYELGFETAVQALCEKFQQQHDLRIEFVTDRKPKPLSDDMRILLFRAIRELLVNIVKHARADRVQVSCQRNNSQIVIIVTDDGIGFEPAATAAPAPGTRSFGLFSNRERLHHLGGEMTIDSSPGHGTRVTLAAPVQESIEEEVVP